MLKAVVKLYWIILLAFIPMIYILVPSGLKTTPVGLLWPLSLLAGISLNRSNDETALKAIELEKIKIIKVVILKYLNIKSVF